MRYSSAVFRSAIFAALSTSLLAADSPQWRGTNRDGRVDATTKNWPKTLQRDWRMTVGEGHSSPLVVGDKVYQFSRDNDRETVRCLKLKDGKEVWSKSYDAPYKMHSAATRHGKGPKSTPVFADGRLLTFGISGILTCFDADSGKTLWRKEFTRAYKTTSPLYGTAMSPIVYGGAVIAHVGGHDHGALIAFDVKTGKPKWEWDNDGPAYASPIILKAGGTEQLITQTQRTILGLNPKTGRELWRVPYKTSYDQNSITPLAFGDTVIVSGYGNGTQCYRFSNTTAGLQRKELWSTQAISMYMSTPVIHGKYLFGMSHRNSGQMFCASPQTGKVFWTGDGRFARNAELLAAKDAIIVLKNDGELLLVEPTFDRLTIRRRYRVSQSETWARPVIAGDKLLIKDKMSLLCYSLR